MHQIVAAIGAHKVIYTREYRPEGHGKIEAFNRVVRGQFLCELKASHITTLDELNEAFRAWSDVFYNAKTHSETGEPPLQRWKAGADRVQYVEEEVLRQAFLWKEDRTPDKAGVFSLLGVQYQVGPGHARRKLQVRFDPEAMHEVEVWRSDKFLERVRPLQIGPHRRPVVAAQPQPATLSEAKADWLAHLVGKHRDQSSLQPAATPTPLQRREAADQAVIDLLAQRLDSAAFDETAARDWLSRFGPLDPEHVAHAIDAALARGMPRDQHVHVTLDFILTAIRSPSP
jgi:putative transposase